MRAVGVRPAVSELVGETGVKGDKVERVREQAGRMPKKNLDDQPPKLFRHPRPINVRIEWSCLWIRMVKLVRAHIDTREVCNAVLVVKEHVEGCSACKPAASHQQSTRDSSSRMSRVNSRRLTIERKLET